MRLADPASGLSSTVVLAIWATDCWEIAPLCSDRVCPASVDVLDSTPEFVVVAHDAAMIDRVLHHEDNTDENKRLARVLIETQIIKPGWQIKPTLRVTGICDLDATAQESDGCAIGTKIPLVEVRGFEPLTS